MNNLLFLEEICQEETNKQNLSEADIAYPVGLMVELQATYETKHCYRHQNVSPGVLKPVLKMMYDDIKLHYSLGNLEFKAAYRRAVTIAREDPTLLESFHDRFKN